MRALGIILLIIAGATWVCGGNLVFAAQRRRLGVQGRVFSLSPVRFKSFTVGEKRWLLALLLATCVIGLLGLASLQGAFG